MSGEQIEITDRQYDALRSKVKDAREALETYKKDPSDASASKLKDVMIELLNGATALLDELKIRI